MTRNARIFSLFVTVALAACAKVDQGPMTGAGTGGRGTGTGSGGGGVATGTGGGGVVPGTGGDNRGTMGAGGGGGESSCGMENFNLVRKPPEILLVLDRSASMKDDLADKATAVVADQKWSHLVPALTAVIRGATDILWGLKVFPESPDGSSCVATSVTPKIDLPVAEMSSETVAGHITTNVMPNGDGTPTGPAVLAATTYLKSRMTDNRKYILLATDGQPSCGGTPGALVSGSDVARTDAVAAVTAAATAGYHTFVVGVATTKETDKMTLNMLANAGRQPRNDPNPLADHFFLASTQKELTDAFKIITGVASTCLFPLSKPPPVPENIAVKVSGTKAPVDSSNTNGWNYTDSTHTAVEVFGPWCEMIKAAADKVEIIFGCPNVPIP